MSDAFDRVSDPVPDIKISAYHADAESPYEGLYAFFTRATGYRQISECRIYTIKIQNTLDKRAVLWYTQYNF